MQISNNFSTTARTDPRDLVRQHSRFNHINSGDRHGEIKSNLSSASISRFHNKPNGDTYGAMTIGGKEMLFKYSKENRLSLYDFKPGENAETGLQVIDYNRFDFKPGEFKSLESKLDGFSNMSSEEATKFSNQNGKSQQFTERNDFQAILFNDSNGYSGGVFFKGGGS